MQEHGIQESESIIKFKVDIDGLVQQFLPLKAFYATNTERELVISLKAPGEKLPGGIGVHG